MKSQAIVNTPEHLYIRGRILLVIVTLIWGTNFPLVKDAVSSLSPSVVVAVRCAIALLPFLFYLRNLSPQLLRDGAILGILLFAPLSIQAIAVESICANRAAFIVGLNIILVPLLGQFLGQRIFLKTFLAAFLALAGIGIMSWENGALGLGDVLMFIDAIAYSIYILFLESASSRHPSLELTAIQMVVITLMSAVWAAPEIGGQLNIIKEHFGTLLYLGLVDTAASTWLQVLAQQWVSAGEMALICSLEPVFAGVFSFLLLGEQFGTRGLIGAGMVLGAMLISQKGNADNSMPTPEPIKLLPAADIPIDIETQLINIPIEMMVELETITVFKNQRSLELTGLPRH